MFTKKGLVKLMIPILIEQTLAVAVGMIDIMMVAYAGENAVSGVSSVDAINLLIIYIITALATGGAVVVTQYLGKQDEEKARLASNQLLVVALLAGLFFMTIALVFNGQILSLILQNSGNEVYEHARAYFYITAISFPFLGLYNGCSSIFRAMRNTKMSMIVSLIMNVINIVGNAILVFKFDMGALGVGIATLASRCIAALIMLYVTRNKENQLYIHSRLRLGWHPEMIKKILKVGIPNGLENGMFQFGKVTIQSLISSLGTVAISANAIAGNVASIQLLPGMAVSIGMITVVGQCVGAGEIKEAKKNGKMLILASYGLIFVVTAITVVLAKPIINVYGLSDVIGETAYKIILWHSITVVFIWPLAFNVPNILKAAGDVKFTMFVSVASMWTFRIIGAYVFVKIFDGGVVSIWMAMTLDWLCRLTLFIWRYRSGKWLNYRVT